MAARASRSRLWHDDHSVVADSDDGRLSFTVVRDRGGVLARRVLTDPMRGRVVLSVVFSDRSSFERWCEAGRLKHAYPLLYRHVSRNGAALFEVSSANLSDTD
jgi:hypothetical protein